MAYYDHLANQWHRITGFKGGAFKEHVLNERLLARLPDIHEKSLLEIGCGNGYFMSLLLKKRSGQTPAGVFLTDNSEAQLRNAQKHFPLSGAAYRQLDVYKPFPFEDQSMDIILSTMVYNEVKNAGLENTVRESKRLLRKGGFMLTTVLHPAFVEKQKSRGVLRQDGHGLWLPGQEGIRLPVVLRSFEQYEAVFAKYGFSFETEDVFGNEKVFRAKPGLKVLKEVPVGLVIVSRVLPPVEEKAEVAFSD